MEVPRRGGRWRGGPAWRRRRLGLGARLGLGKIEREVSVDVSRVCTRGPIYTGTKSETRV